MRTHSFPSLFALVVALTLSANAVPVSAASDKVDARQPLSIDVYHPGKDAVFAVSSVLVKGQSEAILIDAQFAETDARKLVEEIRASSKTLSAIYISHGDPDYYFGLDTLHRAFPQAKIVATPQTVAHIQATKDEKLKIWGPQMGNDAPKAIIVPQPLAGDTLTLEGQELKIMGLTGPTPDRTFVWIPSIRTVAGGIPVMAGLHVWMADTQTPRSHADWLSTLASIQKLKPARVVPGHFAQGAKQDLSAVSFTAGYLRAFDEETGKARDSTAMIKAMKKRYPDLPGENTLELSAKVAKGEMQWK